MKVTKFQRGKAGVWYVRIYLGVDPTTGKERRETICCHTTSEREAEAQRKRIQRQVEDGERIGENPKVADYLERWLADDCAPRLEASTFASYAANVRNKIIPRIGAIRLHDLRPSDLHSLWVEIAKSGGDGGTPLSERSVYYAHAVLRAALQKAVRLELLTHNPAVAATPPSPRHEEQDFLRPEDAKRLIEANEDDEWMPFCLLCLLTGLRRGEALGLYWENVDFEAGTLTVRQARKRMPYAGPVVEGKPKTDASLRTIPLAAEAVAVLRRIRAQMAEASMRRGLEVPDFVFAHILHGKWAGWSPDTAGRALRRLYERAGLPQVDKPVHALRHTQGTLLALAGVHPRVAQKLLGHADFSTTMRFYTHVLEEAQVKAVDAAADLMRTNADKPRGVRKRGGGSK